MKKNLPDIDKLFKVALDGHEEDPSDKVWDALDRNLDKDKVIDFRKKYIHLKKIAIALLLLLIGAGVYTFVTWKKGTGLSTDNLKKKDINSNPATYSLTQTENKNVAPVVDTSKAANTGNINTLLRQTSVLPVGDNSKQNTPAASNKNDNTNAAATINADINNHAEVYKKNAHQQAKNIARSIAVLPKSTGSTKIYAYREPAKNDLNNGTNAKVYTTKRKLKTVASNGGFEEENEAGQVAVSKVEAIRGMPIIKTIYPELLKLNTTGSTGRSVVPVSTFPSKSLPSTVQVSKKVTAKRAGFFTATAFFSPNLSSNFLKDDDDDHNRPGRDHDEDGDDIKKGEQHQSSSSFGLLIDYNFNSHWSVETGLSLTNKTIGINPKTIYAANDGNGNIEYLYNCSSGYTFLTPKSAASPSAGDSLQAFEATNTLQYLAIPLAIKYNFSIKKINLFTSIGASFNMLTKGRLTTEIEATPGSKQTTTSTKIIGLKRGYLGGSIGIGASYDISGRIAFTFMPSYNFAITSSTKGAVVKTYPNAISLTGGIIYKL